jgi:protein disulfide-isomerase-like protein
MRWVLLAGLLATVDAGHSDMFKCRGKEKCAVTELTDANFDSELGTAPHFVMFYAPWCGHCKTLAPTLAKAAKALESTGVRVAAVDVEPNPKTQAKFPDIRGFPSLKFLPGPNPKKAINYDGGRDEGSIIQFAKDQGLKAGAVGVEAVASKTNAEMYTFFGRAALDRKPALLVIGAAAAVPAWVGLVATELRKVEAGKESPEAKTKDLLREAARGTKLPAVREGVADLLEQIARAEKSPQLGPAAVSPAYTSDAATAALFGLSPKQLPALVLAAVDRKTAGGNFVVFPQPIVEDKKGKVALEALSGFVRGALAAATEGPEALAKQSAGAQPLPAFPKPPSVVAAEDREKKRKEKEGGVGAVVGQGSLEQHCYGLTAKTCALLALRGGAAAASADAEISALAKKFAKDGFAFAAVDTESAPAELLNALFGAAAAANPTTAAGAAALAVVKGGKRPRVAVAAGGVAQASADLSAFLDGVVAGGAFEKLAGGLPAWGAPDPEGAAPADTADAISDDEL